MKEKCVVFAHGKESGPWGTKIKILANVAKLNGFDIESPDYSGMMNPDDRVEHLLKLDLQAKELILVGSSMGGYVSAVASKIMKPRGLFLLAPAFFIPGFKEQSPKPVAEKTWIIHGWKDDIVPVGHSMKYAQEHLIDLHLLNDGHRLFEKIQDIEKMFELFLNS